jgi:hypothetical protein
MVLHAPVARPERVAPNASDRQRIAPTRWTRSPPGASTRKPQSSPRRAAFQEPIKVGRDPARVDDREYVQAKYEEVRRSIQGGMDALARRRRLPLMG